MITSCVPPKCVPQKLSADAFAEAYKRGLSTTERFLISRGCHPDTAEELAQAAWVKGWQHLGQLRQPSLLTNWVNSIALNLRRSVGRMPIMLPLEDTGVSACREPNVDLERALASLSETERRWLEGFHFEGRAIRDLATVDCRSEGALRIRLHRIRRKMKSVLQ
jgi:DNA-directed RNA polymerase specialized sigma24 family protein